MSDFATCLNCMDGRVQLPAIEFIQKKVGLKYVDMITEAGIIKIISSPTEHEVLWENILERVNISYEKHGSKHLFLIAHDDCAGNPLEESIQKEQLEKAWKIFTNLYPFGNEMKVIPLWINRNWQVEELTF